MKLLVRKPQQEKKVNTSDKFDRLQNVMKRNIFKVEKNSSKKPLKVEKI